MKKIYYKENTGISADKLIFAMLGDLGIQNFKDMKRINSLLNKYQKANPDYILLLGDLVDDAKINREALKCIKEILQNLSKIAKTYMILGNHDLLSHENGKLIEYNNANLIDMYAKEVQLLMNETITLNEGVSLSGIYFSGNYYEEQQEESKVFLNIINKMNLTPDNELYNILMAHSSNNLFEAKIVEQSKILKDYDLFLSAHMHYGMIPAYLDFLPSHRGFVAYRGSHLQLFPDNCRGEKQINEHVSGISIAPVKTLSPEQLNRFNLFYPNMEQYLVLKR